MASIFYKTGGNFSALTPQKVVASVFAMSTVYQAYNALDTVRYITFTPSEAGDCEGAFVYLSMGSASGSASVTVVLQENVASVWTDRATASLTYLQIAGAHTNNAGPGSCVYFEFSSPYAITAVADTWRLKLSATNSSARLRTTYSYGIVLTDTTVYSSGDNIFFKDGEIFTIDQSITWTNAMAGVNAHFVWANPPAAAYTVTGTGVFYPGKDFRLEIGTEADPIPATEKATWSVAGWSNPSGHEGSHGQELELWGEIPLNPYTLLAANAAAGQKNIVTTGDMSAKWSGGDEVLVLGRNAGTSGTGYQSFTIDSISGTTITMTANLSYQHMAGWAVINWTKRNSCGVVIASIFGGQTAFMVEKLSGVYVTGGKIIQTTAWNAGQDTARQLPIEVDSCYFLTSALTQGAYVKAGSTFSNIFSRTNGWSGMGTNMSFSCSSCTFNDFYLAMSQDPGFAVTGTGNTITDIQSAGGYYAMASTGYPSASLNITGCTVTRFYTLSGSSGLNLSSIASTLIDCRNGGARWGMAVGTIIDTTFSNCDFGQTITNTNCDVLFGSSYSVLTCHNCDFGAVEQLSIGSATLGSALKAHEYDSTVNDHRSWWVYGNMVSTGDGLTDTTVHTAGSGKFAIRLTPTSSTNRLEWEFNVPTGNIQNKTMTVAVWCKINSATYYAGTHQKPRLNIDYDNGTVVYAEAAANTNWQLLSVNFTPTTTYGQITLTLSGMTDATGSNAYIYFDDFAVLYPAGYSLNLGGMDLWADALPVVPPIATVLSAKDVWTAADTEDYGSSTMGNKLKKLKNATAIIDGEIIV